MVTESTTNSTANPKSNGGIPGIAIRTVYVVSKRSG